MSDTRPARTGSGMVWARVEDGFHVCSQGGNFLGYIDRNGAGRFLAYDMRSREVGAFTDLTSAMRAVASQPSLEPQRRP